MTILRPIFGRGVAQRRLGAEVPELHQKFPLSLGAPAVPKAQNWSSQKICLGPPSLNSRKKIKFFRGQEGPENSEIRVWNRGSELHVGKTTRANLSKSNSTCVGARRAGHTFGQICPEIFFLQKMVRNDVLSDGKDL